MGGEYGLKKNNFLAAEHFLQSDDSSAAYYLGRIFYTDPLLRDDNLAKEYLTKAARNSIYNASDLLDKLNN